MLCRTAVCLAVLASGCAAHESSERTSSERDPSPEPTTHVAKASIASVQMIEDCPDSGPAPDPPPPPEPPASAEPMGDAAMQQRAVDDAAAPRDIAAGAAARSRIAAGAPARGGVAEGESARGFAPMPDSCTQSTMQIAFTGQGDAPARVRIESIRLLDADGHDVVGRITARRPTAWREEGGYAAWDETIAPNTDVKASYSLSVPDWIRVERKIGEQSMGHMFVLEVTVEVGGKTQRIRSPEFPREEPHIIVT